MKRLIAASIASAFLLFGAGSLAAIADGVTPPAITPATTCMNCK